MCNSGEDRNAGLCYPKCRSGYNGVGPVCWGNPPSGWVNCGMGAAKTSATCAMVTGNQIISIGNMAVSIATLGGSSSAKASFDLGNYAKIKDMYNKIKAFYDANKAAIETTKTIITDAVKVKTAITAMAGLIDGAASDETKWQDLLRNTALLISAFDPTGVSGVVAAYAYAKCSTYFK